MMKGFKHISVSSANFAVLFLMVIFTAVSCRNPLPSCEDPLGCVTIRPNDPIQIAYMLSLSGDTAVIGNDSLRGIELAVVERGDQLLDHPIELVRYDSGCNLRLGGRAAESIVESGTIVGIIGPTCSDVARSVIPTVNEAGQLLISPSATASNLIDAQPADARIGQNGFLRTVPNYLTQAEVAARFAREELQMETAVTIQDGSDYARELQQRFSQTFQRLGGRVLFHGTVVVGETAVQDIVAELVAEQPDVIYLPLFAPEANVVALRLLESDDSENITLIGTDSLFNQAFAVSAETTVENMFVTGTAVSGPAYERFLASWQIQFETLPQSHYHAYSYDAANILLDAITQVAISEGDSLLIGRQALRDAVFSLTTYQGLTGEISCAATGDCAANESVGVYQLSSEEISGRNWPPQVVWKPAN
jgi:branched-chain amino acid transport system substrate-binding protein